MTIYVDASALVKLCLEETESFAAREYLEAHGPRATSRLASVEVPRALLRRPGGDPRDAADVLRELTLVDFDAAIAETASLLGPPTLRALDAIHLATALELGPDLEALVTYDISFAAAARALGIPVVMPGAEGDQA